MAGPDSIPRQQTLFVLRRRRGQIDDDDLADAFAVVRQRQAQGLVAVHRAGGFDEFEDAGAGRARLDHFKMIFIKGAVPVN